MLTATELAAMRATSLAALPDTVTITRAAGTPVFNPSTGLYTTPTPTTVHNGAARVRPASALDQTALFGDTQVTRARYIVTLPHDVADLAVDDQMVVTAWSDPHIDDLALRITVVPHGSWLIDRRVGAEVIE